MIDWLSFYAFCTHEPIEGSKHLVISPDGSIEKERHLGRDVSGSYDDTVKVWTTGVHPQTRKGCKLYVTGNPCKFLQGHNLFGWHEPHGLVVGMMDALTHHLGLQPTKAERDEWLRGIVQLTRVDINLMFDVRSSANARAWIRAAESQSCTRQGRAQMKGGTLYWQKTSRRWAVKAYVKADEIKAGKKHRPAPHADLPALHEWNEGLLRLELTLRKPELEKERLDVVANWNDETPEEMFNEYVGRIKMSENVELKPEEIEGLPPRLRLTYDAWRRGDDLRAMLPARTFYRYRRQLLEYGVDIRVKREKEHENVIPLMRVIEAVPASPPDWVYGTDLFYEPPAVGEAAIKDG